MALLVALLRERTGPISDSTVDRLARELEEILHELQASARKAEGPECDIECDMDAGEQRKSQE